MKRSLRAKPLTGSSEADYEVNEIINDLINGLPVSQIPAELTQKVITVMTSKRKNAILQRKDSLASKYEKILSELKYGPNKFAYGFTESPEVIRSRSLVKSRAIQDPNLFKTVDNVMGGLKIKDIDPVSRQQIVPVLKTQRTMEISRQNNPTSRCIDEKIDQCDEYSIDSKRLAPRLLKVAAIEEKLHRARDDYERMRLKVHNQRQEYEALEAAAAEEMEKRIKDDMLEYGSHVPTSIPLEFSKVSSKVLDLNERSIKAAQLRKYEDSDSLRKEAHRIERKELDQQNEKFIKSFKLNKQQMLKKQDEKRACFREIWRRKKDKVTREINEKLLHCRKAIENLEKELEYAQMSAGKEVMRIKVNEERK